MTRRERRAKTPIFDALASRYNSWNGWPNNTDAEWALGAYMRGFTYGLVLQDMVRPPEPARAAWPTFTEAWNATHPDAPWDTEAWHFTPPSPWDAIDATPNEHDPNL